MFVPNQKALREACKIVGAQSELARRIGRHRARVNYWINNGGKMHYEDVVAIEAATGGLVTCQELVSEFQNEPNVEEKAKNDELNLMHFHRRLSKLETRISKKHSVMQKEIDELKVKFNSLKRRRGS